MTAPTADIVDVSPDPRYLAVGLVSVAFNEAVLGVDVSPFKLTRNNEDVKLEGLAVGRVDGAHYTLDLSTLTRVAATYELTLLAGVSTAIQDAAGNLLVTGAVESFVVTAHNWTNPQDVNNDARVTPRDVLILINYINRHGSGPAPIPPATSTDPPLFLDVSDDGEIGALDALTVVNFLNSAPANAGEAEGATLGPYQASAESTANPAAPGLVAVQPDVSAARVAPQRKPEPAAFHEQPATDGLDNRTAVHRESKRPAVGKRTARAYGFEPTRTPRPPKDAGVGETSVLKESDEFEALLDLLAADTAVVLRQT
jgi:hypothetical protein